ncbi:MAG TPA: 1-acyl-sn-glycerol-3-phosphate acyltransferase, partial [Polyangiaceae bacterium]|nr:1-acyl-sn-glycerol-3-phosphate acyltransferase [Polyangiaceae bacterium]
MTQPELTHPYAPNPLLRRLFKTLFDPIQVEEGWADQVRRCSELGSVLYVLPNLNWLDFLALDYLTKREGLPPIRYVNDLGLWLLNPDGPNVRGQGLWNMLLPNQRENPESQLRDAVENGGSAALFLKRPPSVLDVASGASGGRGLREGDALISSIFRLQRESARPLILVPLLFVWSKAPDKLGGGPVDFVLGPRIWPSPARALGQLASNWKHASLRWAEPIDLGEFLAQNTDLTDPALVRRLTYRVLRRLERERRAVVGPTQKPVERVRAEILRSPRLRTLIDDLADHVPSKVHEKRNEAAEMLSELQARPDPSVVKGMGVALRWGFNRIYRGIEFDPKDIDRIREASRSGALMLLPSHKSHIDYLILSYFFYERNLPLPHIAAGDNLNFQPVGPIFRRAGAFFIRRSFKGDRLYAAVVDAYIRRLIRDGFPIELFLEGARSRTGKLLEPKFGLLNMIVDAALGVPQQTVHFVPISIGYERVVEADSYQRELSGGEKKKEEAADLLSASEVLRHRYGRINLQVGTILTLDDIRAELGITAEQSERPAKRRALVTRLGNRMMDEINRVTAVTPGSLAALALLASEAGPVTEQGLIGDTERLLGLLRRLGARVSTAAAGSDGRLRAPSIREALQMFVDADLLNELPSSLAEPAAGPRYQIVRDRRIQLDTSKNIIVHFFVERGLVSCAFNRAEDGSMLPTTAEQLEARVLWASRLFKHEFRFRADAPFEEIFRETLDDLVRDGHLERTDAGFVPGPGEAGWSGNDWLAMYRAVIHVFFEGYLVAAHGLDGLLTERMTEKDLVKAALTLGRDLLSEGRIDRPEAISKPLFGNAFHAFSELGFLRTVG